MMMTGRIRPPFLRYTVCAAMGLALAGCEQSPFEAQRFSDMFTRPASNRVSVPEPEPDNRGVIRYDSFAVIVAREGDTIGTMAGRIGVAPEVLATYNGLPENYLMRPGERLAIPDSVQIAAVEEGWTPEIVVGALDAVPDSQRARPADPPGTIPVRHKVEPGETAFSIAKLYGVSVTALASWNGLGGDLTVTPGRSLIIPVPEIAEAPVQSEPGEATAVAPPPSAAEPLPENPPDAATPESPDLGQFRTAASGAIRLSTPVQGKVVKPFSKAAGPNKNDGIDYETAPGAPVKAADDGEVALVSRSLGGLGTIVPDPSQGRSDHRLWTN